ncbi:armadillo-type protein [Mycena leptocephala]|nr:armadillo-type protein [Mycena leptocephala]
MSHPLTRQRTPESLISWWSDTNPPGATISIHAAAKPLMRFMYHRDALDLIKRNHNIPLSGETLDIYGSYIGYMWALNFRDPSSHMYRYKYVSPSTKAMILRELYEKAISEDNARAIVNWISEYHVVHLLKLSDREFSEGNANAVEAAMDILSSISQVYVTKAIMNTGVEDFVANLVESPSTEVQTWTWKVLKALASHESTVMAVVDSMKLRALLRENHDNIAENTLLGLSNIFQPMDGAKAAVDASALEFVTELLESRITVLRAQACTVLANLASHESMMMALVGIGACVKLVAVLSDNVDVVEPAVLALSKIAPWLDGASALMDAQALDPITELLESRSIVFSGDLKIVEQAVKALSRISHWPDGARAIMDTQALDFLPQLLKLRSLIIRLRTGEMLIRGNDVDVVTDALRWLSEISCRLDGAKAVIDSGVLNLTPKLLESPSTEVREQTCRMVACLALHESTMPDELVVGLCAPLVALLSDNEQCCSESAARAVAAISLWPEGARLVADVKALKYSSRLNGSQPVTDEEPLGCYTRDSQIREINFDRSREISEIGENQARQRGTAHT